MARMRREVPYWVIGVVTVSVIFFTYLGYSMTVTKLADRSVAAIHAGKDAILSYSRAVAAPGAAAPTDATQATETGLSK